MSKVLDHIIQGVHVQHGLPHRLRDIVAMIHERLAVHGLNLDKNAVSLLRIR
jgi:hypothetical protein